jgi:hypothetical protein
MIMLDKYVHNVGKIHQFIKCIIKNADYVETKTLIKSSLTTIAHKVIITNQSITIRHKIIITNQSIAITYKIIITNQSITITTNLIRKEIKNKDKNNIIQDRIIKLNNIKDVANVIRIYPSKTSSVVSVKIVSITILTQDDQLHE